MIEGPGIKTQISWTAVFVLWFAWESAILITLHHREWNLSSALFFTAMNVVYGIAWSVVLSTAYLLLLAIAGDRLKKLLKPATGASLGALLCVTFILHYRAFLLRNTFSLLFRWGTGIVLAVAILILCLAIVRIVTSRWKRPGMTQLRLFFGLLPIPLLWILSMSFFGQNKITESAKGPIQYVVLISIDTLRYDYVGAYHVTGTSTPVMDRVASEGALYETAVSSIPHTGPSHTSMLTGQPPLAHGVYFNGQPLTQDSPPTIAQRLRNAEFRTGGFISGLPLKTLYSGLNRGFQTYDDNLAFSDHFSESVFGRMWQTIPFHTRCLRRTAKEVTGPALKWLDRNADQPFFLFLHYYDPHYPYGSKVASNWKNPWEITKTPRDLPEQKRLYAQQVEAVDDQIGRVIDLLKNRGIYDRTLLIITSDHGESLGEHNYFYGHDYYVYEQLVRVPMILRCPPLIKPGVTVHPQVALYDIYKTILEATGLPAEKTTAGFSLIQMANQAGGDEERVILSHNFVSEVHGLRTRNFKLIRNDRNSKREYELYNLIEDPGENRDLFASSKEPAITLKNLMTRAFAAARGIRSWKPENLDPEQLENLKSLGYFQ